MRRRVEGVKRSRTYDSPLRREQAARTRRQILEAAKECFEQDGYAATSMSAIASAAGVSLKTVYLVFETKSGLLRALWHLVLRGEQDNLPVGAQPWFTQVLDEPDPADKHALATGLDVAGATDILWALNHPSLYSLLARERDWPDERYERWLADLFCAQLLGRAATFNEAGPGLPAPERHRPRAHR